MKRQFIMTIAALAILTSAQMVSAAPPKVAPLKSTPYYPMAVGTERDYEGITNGAQAPMLTEKIVRHEKIGGVMCVRLEVYLKNRRIAVEYVTLKADGVYRIQTNGIAVKPPLKILSLPVKAGTSWKAGGTISNQKISGTISLSQKTIKVPAGQFKNAAVVHSGLKIGKIKLDSTVAFAKGFGMIYQKLVFSNGVTVIQKLKAYRPAKKKK